MANAFSKEERVAFEALIEGFHDAQVMAKNVSIYSTDSTMMERASDTVWRPMPYIAQSFAGTNMTGNFKDYTQLSVPATLGFGKSVPWQLSAKELRDALQEKRLGEAAKQKLASDINLAVLQTASNQGTLVVKRTSAAQGYDDVALCDSIMNEQGVAMGDRYLTLTSRDYNSAAGNLAARQTLQGKAQNAYERAFLGEVAGFDTFKLDYGIRQAAAGGGAITIDTTVPGANYYTPRATSTAGTGEVSNVDNRYQNITVSATAGVAAGDAFTIAGVEAVHHITKQSTGQLKTFRVISVVNGTTLRVSPAIVSNQGGTDAEAQYQNVLVTPNAAAAITWLNTAAAPVNVFWHKDAIELLPGRYAVPTDAGAGTLRATLPGIGIEVVMQKQYDINTMQTKYRLDTLFGVVNKAPEMSGILLFNQI